MKADVISVGARGPLGLSALQVTMCLRARKLEPRSTAFFDRRGQEIGMALSAGLGEKAYGFSRMLGLAAPALAEAAAALPEVFVASEQQPLPTIVCLPEEGRADDAPPLAERFVQSLATRSGVRLDLPRSSLVRLGQAGFGYALQRARDMLDSGVHAVCVGGVDSYYHPQVLKQLDAEYRLHAMGADAGFIPSEAAAFLVLARAKKSAARLGTIVDVEVAEELSVKAGGGDDDEPQPNIASAMTALLATIQQRTGHDYRWVITDFNGERHREREWDMASGRVLPNDTLHSKWVWDSGDVGAASGALFTTIFMQFQALQGAYAPTALLALHSEAGQRAVVALAGAGHD